MKVSRAWSQFTAWFLVMLIKCFVLVDFWWCLWRNARRWWILAHTFLLRCFQWSFVDLCQRQWSWSPQKIADWFLVDLRRTWFRSQIYFWIGEFQWIFGSQGWYQQLISIYYWSERICDLCAEMPVRRSSFRLTPENSISSSSHHLQFWL